MITILVKSKIVIGQVDKVPDMVTFIKEYFNDLRERFGEIPEITLEPIKNSGSKVMLGEQTDNTVKLNGVLLIPMWIYDEESTRIILKFLMAHEYMHWQLWNGYKKPKHIRAEQVCNVFGVYEADKTFDEIIALINKLFIEAFKSKED